MMWLYYKQKKLFRKITFKRLCHSILWKPISTPRWKMKEEKFDDDDVEKKTDNGNRQ